MNIRDARYGDVISVDRTFYDHFGVYSGNNRVIHYVKVGSLCEGEIQETSADRFLDGDDAITIHHFPTTKAGLLALLKLKNNQGSSLAKIFDADHVAQYKLYSPGETVQRARSKIGTGDYSIFGHNCEHFAIWCKTGVEQSKQVDNTLGNLLDFFLNPFA